MIATPEILSTLETVNARVTEGRGALGDLEVLGVEREAVRYLISVIGDTAVRINPENYMAARSSALVGFHAGLLLGRGMVE